MSDKDNKETMPTYDELDKVLAEDEIAQAGPENPPVEEPPVEEPPAEEPPVEEPPVEEPPVEAAKEKASEEEELEKEEPPKEPVDNSERSNLGRKVKRLTETVESLAETVQTFVQAQTGNPEMKVKMNSGEEEEEEFTPPQTQEEFDALVEKREAKRMKAQADYEAGYLAKVSELGSGRPEEDHLKISDLMMKKFNVKHSNDSVRDAETNYLRASAEFYREQALAIAEEKRKRAANNDGAPPQEPPKETPKVNLRDPNNQEPTRTSLASGSGGTNTRQAKKPRIVLDEAAADFVRRVKMSEKDVEEAFAGDVPPALMPRGPQPEQRR